MIDQKERVSSRNLADTVRIQQNRIEEARREAFLADKLFHSHMLLQDDFKEIAAEIHAEFMTEKKGKSMLERFDLATSERYLGVIHVVELGVSSAPAVDGALDGLKDEYAELRDFMVANGLLDREMSREESGRTLSVERAPITGFVVISRNRPLMSGRAGLMMTDHDRVHADIGIAKRMVFSMKTPMYIAIADRFDDPGLKSEEAITFVEAALERQDPGIGAIRTAYYLATEL